jgi:hypothetical protein
LTLITCGANQLTALDISANTALTYLSCNSCQLTALDLSANTALTYLSCNSNQLTALDLSANTALTYLSCNSNQLTALDLSANTLINQFSAISNPLASLTLGVPAGSAYFIISDDLVVPITASKASLEAWFATLPEIETDGDLYVGDAVLALDPAPDTTIATAKGWTVTGDFA